MSTGTFWPLDASSGMEKKKPCQNVLIVEDQYLIAISVEDAVIEAGFEVCGLATCKKEAMDLVPQTDIALVDINLRDGRTGPEIGAALAAAGKTVIFMTGNPNEVSGGVDGALGVISKPVLDAELGELVRYAASHCSGSSHPPPRNLKLFFEQ